MWSCTSSGGRVPSKRRSRPRLLVVVDERLGLVVVDRRGACGSSRACRRRAGSSSRAVGRRRPRAWAGRTRRGRRGPFFGHDAAAGEAAHDLVVGRRRSAARAVRSRPALLERLVERLGLRRPCAGSRRAGSRRAASSPSRRLEDHADDHVVGHELAGVHVLLGLRPSSVPSATASRRMSPVAMYGRSKSSRRRSACVPLPAPGGPSRMRFSSTRGRSQSPWGPGGGSARPREGRASYFRKPS